MKHEFLRRRTLAGLLLFSLLTSTAAAATFTVTSTDDNGPGSLREAINNANEQGGADTINFSVSGTIVLGATLPDITDVDGLTIDGTGQDVTISGDHAVRVMVVRSTLALEGLTVANGRDSIGGGILNAGTLTISNSIISGNSASDDGGGIYNNRNLTVTNSTFSGNSVVSVNGNGGGISNDGDLSVTNSTFSENRVRDLGGGIFSNSTLTVTSSTFSGNAAQIGGGIFCSSTLTVTSSTFSGNIANIGGGITNGGTLNLTNTILANSRLGDDCASFDTLNPTGVNLIEDGSCAVQGALSGDPLLAPLADNGGPTQTMALLPGSPALNAITDSSCPPPDTDQRGVRRPQEQYCDIGAFELRQLPVSCRSTGDLRSGGSTDTVRITNQGAADLPYSMQFVNAQGSVQGKPVPKSLTPNQSASNSVGTLMQQAGIRSFNPANLLQIQTTPTIGATESWLQSVLTPTNGTPPVMMVYTCEPSAQPR